MPGKFATGRWRVVPASSGLPPITIHQLCESGLVLAPLLDELEGRELTERRVWSVGVVLDPEVLGQHLGFEQRLEGLDVEQLVAQLAVERLDERVLPRAARLDVDGAGRREPTPVPQRVGGELGAVVHAQELGCRPLGGHEASRTATVSSAVMERCDVDGQGLLGELVGDVRAASGS